MIELPAKIIIITCSYVDFRQGYISPTTFLHTVAQLIQTNPIVPRMGVRGDPFEHCDGMHGGGGGGSRRSDKAARNLYETLGVRLHCACVTTSFPPVLQSPALHRIHYISLFLSNVSSLWQSYIWDAER